MRCKKTTLGNTRLRLLSLDLIFEYSGRKRSVSALLSSDAGILSVAKQTHLDYRLGTIFHSRTSCPTWYSKASIYLIHLRLLHRLQWETLVEQTSCKPHQSSRISRAVSIFSFQPLHDGENNRRKEGSEALK